MFYYTFNNPYVPLIKSMMKPMKTVLIGSKTSSIP